MEVMTPSPPVEFKFDSTSTSPFLTPSSSPPHHHFTHFFSAPTSPSSSSFRHRLDTFSSAAIPFSWEEKPGTPKSKHHPIETEADFEFDFFSGQLDRTSLSNLSAADELFDGGVIKPLKPPPRLQFSENNNVDSPKSPKSPSKAKFLKEALSPRHHHRKKDFDPFEAAIEQTRRENNNKFERGRERSYDSSNSSSRRQKGTRSLSPFRVCDIFAENYQESSSSSASSSTKNSGWRGYKKWKLKDFLLFRSASEGRVKNSSFRFTESSGSVSRRRGPGGQVSAHELHYTKNRAVSEEMRRKTFLPYNHGLLGCLGFNPAVHDISRGIGSMTRG